MLFQCMRVAMFVYLLFSLSTFSVAAFAEGGLGPIDALPPETPLDATAPAGRSLRSTQRLENQFREQQYRFQPNQDRRQLRPRRPEPGETEVNREGERLIPDIDKGARMLKGAIAPETPRRPPYQPSLLRVPDNSATQR